MIFVGTDGYLQQTAQLLRQIKTDQLSSVDSLVAPCLEIEDLLWKPLKSFDHILSHNFKDYEYYVDMIDLLRDLGCNL